MEHAENWKARWGKRRWYRFTRMQTRVAKRLRRIITVSENSATDILADHEVPADRLHIVPVGVDPDLFRPLTGVERVPLRIISTASADVPMKGQRFLLEAVAKLRAERSDVSMTIIGSLKDGSRTHSTLDRLGLRDCVSSSAAQRRAHRRFVPEASVAASLAVRVLAAGDRGDGGWVSAGPPPVGPARGDWRRRRHLLPVPRDATFSPSRGPGSIIRRSTANTNVAANCRGELSWKRTAERTVTHYRPCSTKRLRNERDQRTPTSPTHTTPLRGCEVLTVDFDRLDLKPGHRFLDIGAGAGRHCYEAARRGAHVVALDYDADALPEVHAMLGAMVEVGEAPANVACLVIRGDALKLPFPDASFDRIVVSEVLEHIDDDAGVLAEIHRVLRPGGIVAATVPAWFPEKICWWLSAEYHAPLVPGGHLRIYTEPMLTERVNASGLRLKAKTYLHSPYWWLRCLAGPTNDTNRGRRYHRLLVWDMTKAPATRTSIGDGPPRKSLVAYAGPRRPSGRTVTRSAAARGTR
jgi:SAM-dependent methyltransferase